MSIFFLFTLELKQNKKLDFVKNSFCVKFRDFPISLYNQYTFITSLRTSKTIDVINGLSNFK